MGRQISWQWVKQVKLYFYLNFHICGTLSLGQNSEMFEAVWSHFAMVHQCPGLCYVFCRGPSVSWSLLRFGLQNPLIPDEKREDVVSHIVLVHQSVVVYSKKFLQRLRRSNYVTPKNYLDFINTYLRLLDDQDKFILAQVCNCLDSAINFYLV